MNFGTHCLPGMVTSEKEEGRDSMKEKPGP
jgi:hypothetical protein